MTQRPLSEWAKPSSPPPLGNSEVHIWRVHLPAVVPSLHVLGRSLSLEEQVRAARFRHPWSRTSFVAGRGILRQLLGSHLGLDPEAVPISLSVYGKPECAFSGSGISFSLSHSKNLLLLALGRARSLGVDVEYVDRNVPALQLARRFFADEEALAIASRKGDVRHRLFFEIWVQKEACLKAVGRGLSIPLDTFMTTLACNPQIFHVPGIEGHHKAMFLRGFSPFAEYVAALATDPPRPRLNLLDWQGPKK